MRAAPSETMAGLSGSPLVPAKPSSGECLAETAGCAVGRDRVMDVPCHANIIAGGARTVNGENIKFWPTVTPSL